MLTIPVSPEMEPEDQAPDLSWYRPGDDSIQEAEKGSEKPSEYTLRPRSVKTYSIPYSDSEEEALIASVEDAFLACDAENLKPSEAFKDERWRVAMEKEISAMSKNGVWELAELPEGRKAIKCRWVFKIKRDTSGKIVKHKARLVGKGYSQVPNLEYHSTFAPTATIGVGNIIEPALSAYADADFSSNLIDRRSFTGYVVKLGTATVSWESRKQETVALSTAEAEYMALGDAYREIKFLSMVYCAVMNIDPKVCKHIPIYSDSQSAISICNSENLTSRRTKHIDTKHHFIREAVEQLKIVIKYVPTNEMIADFMTKPLPRVKHEFCVDKTLWMSRK